MNTTLKKTLVLAGALLTGLLVFGQEPAAEVSQETVLVANPNAVKAQVPVEGQVAEQKAPAQKFEWKSEEAKKRMAGQVGDSSKPAAVKVARQNDGPPPWRLLVAFGVMALLLYGLYLFLKRFGKRITGQEGIGLKVVTTVKLDSRNSLKVIQFHEEELLISVNSSGGVSLLSKCSQIELAEAEGNSGRMPESPEDDDGIFDSFEEGKISSSGITTVKEGLK